MGQCERHMEVRGVNDFRPAFVHSDFFLDGLAARAVTVAAGIVVELHMPAVRAAENIHTEFSGLTF